MNDYLSWVIEAVSYEGGWGGGGVVSVLELASPSLHFSAVQLNHSLGSRSGWGRSYIK